MDEVNLPGISFTGDSHIQGDMFNIHDNQSVTIVHSGELKREPTAEPVPECLRTQEANELWEIAKEEGWVDENLQPKGLSRADAALLAARLGKVLGIEGWKPFERLWHRQNMRQDYSRTQYNQKTEEFEKKLKRKLQ